jgi:hypothetical protein
MFRDPDSYRSEKKKTEVRSEKHLRSLSVSNNHTLRHLIIYIL